MDIILAALIDLLIIEPFITSNIGFFIYMLGSHRFNSMTARECLDYSLRKKDDVFVTIGTIKNGVVDWNVYGRNGDPVSKSLHRYEIASITKTVTGALIAQAESEGKLRVDDRIDKYLDLSDEYQYPTIRDLLTHTSGYKSVYIEREVFNTINDTKNILSGVNTEMALRRIEKCRDKKKNPKWRYSNFNYAILGMILESIYKRPYKNLVNDFLKQYGLNQSYISDGNGDLNNYLGWADGDVYMAGGAISSNIEDMLKYVKLHFDNVGPFYDSRTVLKELDINSELCAERNAMCYGWMFDKKTGFYWHNGETPGYKTYIGICPDSQTAVVVLSNAKRIGSLHHIESNIGVKMLEDLQEICYS